MKPVRYLGDGAMAAGLRLAGVVIETGEEQAQTAETGLLLVAECRSARQPPSQVEAEIVRAAPPLLVIPADAERAPGAHYAEAVRRLLGLAL